MWSVSATREKDLGDSITPVGVGKPSMVAITCRVSLSVYGKNVVGQLTLSQNGYRVSATSRATIESIQVSTATHGIPDIIVSNNGSGFTSQEFGLFCRSNGITHIKSAPYHSASTGLAERMVQTLEQGLKKMELRTFQEKFQGVLMAYRNTPHTKTGITPAELLVGRKSKTLLDLAKPNIAERVRRKQSEQKQHHDNKARNRSFSTQQDVYVRNFGTGPQ